MKICLDTNVLMSGIFWDGTPGKIVEHWIDGDLSVVVSDVILEEYLEVLLRFGQKLKSDTYLIKTWEDTIIKKSILIDIKEANSQKLCRDADDEKFIHPTLLSHINYLVSGDKDLLILSGQVSAPVINPKNFLSILKK